MRLRAILEDKYAVSILKLLFDEEVVNKNGYSVNLSTVVRIMNLKQIPVGSIDALSKSGLIGMDIHKDDSILTITEKGKRFILIFDRLVQFFHEKDVKKTKRFKVEYSLTANEKRILFMCYRIAKETGNYFSIGSLVMELFPHDESVMKRSLVSRNITKLEKLNLLKKEKGNGEIFITITDSGQRVIREQLLETFVHV